MKLRIKRKLSTKNNVRLRLADYVALLFLGFGIGRTTQWFYRPILLVIGLCWMFLIVKNFFIKNAFLKDSSVICYLLFVIIYGVLILTSSDISTTIGYWGSYLIYLILYIMAAYYSQVNKIDKMVLICRILLLWIGILSVFAILYYRAYPGAARLYATHRSDLGGYMIGGGYQLAYISAMILPVIVDRFFKKRGTLKLLLLGVVMVIEIYMTTSVITMLTMLIGCFVSFAFSGTKKKKIVSFSVGGMLLILFLVFRNYIGDFLINLAVGKVVTSFSDMNNATFVRMTEIGTMLKGNSIANGSAMSLRLDNYLRPLEDIVKSPIWGSIFTTGVNPSASNYNDSTIITALETWGIPMAFMSLYPLIHKFKKYKSYIGSILVVVITLFLNPSEGFSLYAGAIIMLPTLEYMDSQEKELI